VCTRFDAPATTCDRWASATLPRRRSVAIQVKRWANNVALLVETQLGVRRSAYDVIELTEQLPGEPEAAAETDAPPAP
jgi:hypothetical protein